MACRAPIKGNSPFWLRGDALVAANERGNPYGYLCVDDFLGTLVDARSLATALELGLVDLLDRDGATSFEAMLMASKITPVGLRLLIRLLRANRVLAETGGQTELTPGFRSALRYRDLLEAKIDFAAAVLPDFHALFNELLSEPDKFHGTKPCPSTCSAMIAASSRVLETSRRLGVGCASPTSLTRYEAEGLPGAVRLRRLPPDSGCRRQQRARSR